MSKLSRYESIRMMRIRTQQKSCLEDYDNGNPGPGACNIAFKDRQSKQDF